LTSFFHSTGEQRGTYAKDNSASGSKDRDADEDGRDRYNGLSSDRLLQYSVVLHEINNRMFKVGGFKV